MLSVVVATLNRAGVLRRTLDRLDAQDAGSEAFEVIIAADAAEPDMAAVRAAADGRSYAVRVLQATTPGVSAARNRAWPEAQYPVVLFLGDDMLPSRDVISRHLSHHRRCPDRADAMIGHVRWARELKRTPFMRWLDDGMQFDFGTIEGSSARWYHFLACNGSLKRELLEQSGGFDEDFRFGYEELELACRLKAIGFRLHYDRRAVVEHLHPPTLEAWQQRMAAVAHAERRFHAKHPGMPAYFLPKFEHAAAKPPQRGRAVRLARYVPRGLPWAGRRVWDPAGLWFAQQLAPSFLSAWHSPEPAGQPGSAARGVKPSGSPPGGPK